MDGNTELENTMEINIRPRYLAGPQRIRQRLNVCNCGCHGSDSWHATATQRVVRSIAVLDAPEPATFDGMSVEIIACGEYKHPSGDIRKAGLQVLHGYVAYWVWINR